MQLNFAYFVVCACALMPVMAASFVSFISSGPPPTSNLPTDELVTCRECIVVYGITLWPRAMLLEVVFASGLIFLAAVFLALFVPPLPEVISDPDGIFRDPAKADGSVISQSSRE